MKASCIVCTHSRPSVYQTVNSLKKQTLKPKEIIIVDDNSRVPVKIKDSRVKVLRNKKIRGLSASRNLGVKNSRGKIVAFIDDDATAKKNWLEELNKCFESGAEIVGGLIKPLWETRRPWWVTDDMLGALGVNFKSHLTLGCNFAVMKEVFSKLNFHFDEKIGRKKGALLSGEETELLFRAKEKGVKIKFCPRAVVFHLVPKERVKFKYFLVHYFWDGRTEVRRKRALYHGLGYFNSLLKNFWSIFLKPRSVKKLGGWFIDLILIFPYFLGMIYENLR